jgi:uncharacterized protein DUF6438/ankyrin repeat protein
MKKDLAVVALLMVLVRGIAAQTFDVPADTVIRLQRTSCYGPCPIYTVSIDARGNVTYDGEKFVRATGRQTGRIAPEQVAAILAIAARADFFRLQDSYRDIQNADGTVFSVTDLPTTIVTITANGRTKRVEDYIGAPEMLGILEKRIDATAGITRWVFIDEQTLAELRQSGWSASGDEGAALLREAIGRGEVAIARTLIEMGADLNGPKDDRLPPLIFAGSAAMVDLLVEAGADPNERPVGRVAARTPLMSAVYKDAAVAEALLAAGARLEDLDGGRSALWYAACAGNWRLVTVLLRAGANARGSAEISAIDCTRRARADETNRRRTVLDRGQPTADDFDKVIALLEAAEQR